MSTDLGEDQSLVDTSNEITPKAVKDPISRTLVKQLLPILEKYSFPTGKDNPRFHELLRVIFELLEIDGKDSFENVIRTVKAELKKEKHS